MPLVDLFSISNAEVGNALATYLLDTQGAPVIKGLQDLATNLPLIPLGKVSPTEFGVLSAELQATKAKVAASLAAGAQIGTPPLNLSQLEDQLVSLVSLVTNSFPSATGGLETADQAVATQALGNVAAGINNALQFWQGKQSVPAAS